MSSSTTSAGFGNSKDMDKRGRSAMVDDLTALLDHLKIERTVLVAQSLGGGTCAGFTVRHPAALLAWRCATHSSRMRLPPDVAATMDRGAKAHHGLPQVDPRAWPEDARTHPDATLLYTQLASFNVYSVGNMPGAFAGVESAALAATGVPIL